MLHSPAHALFPWIVLSRSTDPINDLPLLVLDSLQNVLYDKTVQCDFDFFPGPISIRLPPIHNSLKRICSIWVRF